MAAKSFGVLHGDEILASILTSSRSARTLSFPCPSPRAPLLMTTVANDIIPKTELIHEETPARGGNIPVTGTSPEYGSVGSAAEAAAGTAKLSTDDSAAAAAALAAEQAAARAALAGRAATVAAGKAKLAAAAAAVAAGAVAAAASAGADGGSNVGRRSSAVGTGTGMGAREMFGDCGLGGAADEVYNKS